MFVYGSQLQTKRHHQAVALSYSYSGLDSDWDLWNSPLAQRIQCWSQIQLSYYIYGSR